MNFFRSLELIIYLLPLSIIYFIDPNIVLLFIITSILNYANSEKKPIVVHYRKRDSNLAINCSYYDDEKSMQQNEPTPILIVTDSLENTNVFF